MIRNVTTILILIIVSSELFSQERLTLDSAVKIALKNNFGIMIIKNEQKKNDNNFTAGNAGFLPKVELNADYSRSFSNADIETATGAKLDVTGGNADLLNAGINIRWTIFDGMRMFLNYDILEQIKDIGEINTKLFIENSIAKVIISYYNVLRQTEFLNILKEQLEISNFRYNLSKINFETGLGSELELNKSSVLFNFDITDIYKQENILKEAKINLNELLSVELNNNYNFEDSNDNSKLDDFDELLKLMKSNNKKLQAARKTYQLSIKDAERQFSKNYPVIDLKFGYYYYYNDTEVSFIKLNDLNGFAGGLSLNYNIFNGLNDLREYQNAKIEQYSNELRLKDMEISLESYLIKLYNEYRLLEQTSEIEEINYKTSQNNMAIAKESYSAGSISSLELREVQNDLLKAGLRIMDTKFKLKTKQTEILLLCGRIIEN